MRSLGEIALPNFNTGDQHSDVQKKCSQYAMERGAEDLLRNGHVTSATGLQSYVDECARHIDEQRQSRQAMVLLGIVGVAAGIWWLCKSY